MEDNRASSKGNQKGSSGFGKQVTSYLSKRKLSGAKGTKPDCSGIRSEQRRKQRPYPLKDTPWQGDHWNNKVIRGWGKDAE